jgi:30S ribosomal protein S31
MGKGDKKTKKGKIFTGSFGVVRPKKNNSINNISLKIKTEKKEAVKKKANKKKANKKK